MTSASSPLGTAWLSMSLAHSSFSSVLSLSVTCIPYRPGDNGRMTARGDAVSEAAGAALESKDSVSGAAGVTSGDGSFQTLVGRSG
jgi:hypothetical protein